MENKRLGQFVNGGFDIDLDIVVERSSTNDKGVTILLWRKHHGKFRVERYDSIKSKPETILKFNENKNEVEAREIYEKCCESNHGCSPYPEAAKYYKGKGIKLD